MNIVAEGLLPAVTMVTGKLERADKALDAYLEAIGELFAAGGRAGDISGVPSCLLSPSAQSRVAEAINFAAMVQHSHTEIHRALHEDKERLDPQKTSGGKNLPPP